MASTSCRICSYILFSANILMISAWSHKEYEMSSDQVCSRMGRRELPVTFEHPALVRDGGRLFSDWPGIRKYDCRWKVEGKRDGKGVTAVVQKVRLRRASEKDCTDYIQFKRESRVDRAPRICGSVLFGILLEQNDTFPPPNPYPDSVVLSESSDPKSDWMTLAAPGSIVDADGEVLTYVHVAQKKLMQGDGIELVIAYTAFQECREKVPEGSFHCGYGLCISSSLVKDGVINCPFADCIDEGSCQEARDSNVTRTILSRTMSEQTSRSNTVSSSFVALFILVIICLGIYYLYRRNRKSGQSAGQVYGTVNGLSQQQALTGTGYIEIQGTALNPVYGGIGEQPGVILPYPLEASQLQAIEGQLGLQQIAAYPGQPTLVQGYAVQQSPSKGAAPAIGFVVADVNPHPPAQMTPMHLAQITITEPSPVTPENAAQGSPSRLATEAGPSGVAAEVAATQDEAKAPEDASDKDPPSTSASAPDAQEEQGEASQVAEPSAPPEESAESATRPREPPPLPPRDSQLPQATVKPSAPVEP